MSDQTMALLDLLVQVALYGIIYFTGFMFFISPLVIWHKFKLWRDKELKEAERIIIKMNENDKIVKLEKAIELINEKLNNDDKQPEVLIDAEIDAQEKLKNEVIINKGMTVDELRKIAAKRGLKGYSKMKKQKLLNELMV